MVIDGRRLDRDREPQRIDGVGVFGGPVSVTICNGGVLNSQGGAADRRRGPSFHADGDRDRAAARPGMSARWRSAAAARSGDPEYSPFPMAASLMPRDPWASAIRTGTSMLTVTGAGSVLNALTSLVVGDTSCGCGLIGTLTVADGGVVNSPGFTGIAQGSTLNLGTGGLAGGINTPAIDNEGQIVANFTDTLTLAADISGAGTLSKAGVGTLILTGNNSYAGGTTITGGFINFNSANSFGSGLITINGGGLQWATGNSADISAQLAAFGAGGATFDTNGNNVTLAASLSGPGGLIKTGAGTMTLSGVNSYQGGTAINGGTACGHRGRQSRRGGRRPRFRRRHAAIPVGFHHQSHRNAECGRRHVGHQWQQRNACRRDRRSRRPHQGGRRHDDAVGRQHLSRRHDGQCRHAAGRSSECLRSGQRLYDRERRHAQPRGLQPEHRLARRRRRRDLGRCNTHHRQRQHQHDLLRRDLRHWRPDQDRHRHPAAHGDQQLYRRDHRQRRHAVGKRLDRQLRPHRQCRRHHRRQRDDRQHHHQRRHALARQLDRHPHRTGQPGADVGLRLPRRGLAHGCRPHQRHRHRKPRRHRAGGVRHRGAPSRAPTPSSRLRAEAPAPSAASPPPASRPASPRA